MTTNEQALTEKCVQDGFYSFLEFSLSHAKAERLIEPGVLANAKADLMITGPALCLYLAALRSTTSPPSIPLPASSRNAPPKQLTEANCPPAFVGFLRVWASTVPKIQSLASEYQHVLARAICGLEPIAQPLIPEVSEIAAKLRAVATEISQRRSFQDRYPNGLGAVLKRKISLLPQKATTVLFPRASHALERIRQILYAALGDVLAGNVVLGRLLKEDPPRAYFASVSLAILQVAMSATLPDGSVDGGVPGLRLTPDECPEVLKPLMDELGNISKQAKQIGMEDTDAAINAVPRDDNAPAPASRLDTVKRILQEGVGYDRDVSADTGNDDHLVRGNSDESTTVSFSNKINALALRISQVSTFRERQDEVFEILSAVCGN